jgi:hypothetical protein
MKNGYMNAEKSMPWPPSFGRHLETWNDCCLRAARQNQAIATSTGKYPPLSTVMINIKHYEYNSKPTGGRTIWPDYGFLLDRT